MTEAELKGKVATISMEKRQITLKDTDGILHPLTWTEPLDVVMRKWKEGYYLVVKYDGDVLKNASYWQEGKDAFPKAQPPGSGYRGQPKNDRAIIHEVAYQEMQATFRQWLEIQTEPVTFDQLMTYVDTLSDRAKAHAKVMIEGAGVN